MGHYHIISIDHDFIRDAKHESADVEAYKKGIGSAVLDLCVFSNPLSTYLGEVQKTTGRGILDRGVCLQLVDMVHSTQDRVYVFTGNRLDRLRELSDNELEKAIDLIQQEKNRRATVAHDEPSELNLLFTAAKSGNVSEIETALESGWDINTLGEYGWSALCYAINSGSGSPRHEAVKFLLSRGANPNIVDKWGETPLDWACTGNYIDMAKLLIERGAKINHKDAQNRTPLGEALSRGHWELVEHLFCKGAVWSTYDYFQVFNGLKDVDGEKKKFLMKISDKYTEAKNALRMIEIFGRTEGSHDGFYLTLSQDEPRAHVIIYNANGEAHFWLKPKLALAEKQSFKPPQIEEAKKIIMKYIKELHEIWDRNNSFCA